MLVHSRFMSLLTLNVYVTATQQQPNLHYSAICFRETF